MLLVGEIRDEETAQIATHAALTGHLVLSTLHTNDAASALTRLLDLGVPPYLVASTVEAILAQRLVRKVCTQCGEWVADPSVNRVFRGRGCPACWSTGYRGRTGIYELLVMDEEIRASVSRHQTAAEIRGLLDARRVRALKEDGWTAVSVGLTTPEEVLRACGE